jgi:hypothetical protein
MPPMPLVAHNTLIVASALLLFIAFPAAAGDDEFKLTIQNHKFQPEEVVVPSERRVKLIIENRDATPEEFESHALNREKVIAGKSTVMIFIGPLKAERYPFVGEYNEETARGVVVVR